MDKRLIGILQVLLSLGIMVFIVLYHGNIATFAEYGYLGVFLISLLSSATLFLPAPGWAAVLAMSTVLNPYLLGIVAGIGSGVGESTGYLAGGGIKELVANKKKHYKKFENFIKKYDIMAISILAFLPNPLFDIAGLAAGAVKIPYWKYIVGCSFGRVLRYILLAYLGWFTISLLS